MAEKVGGGKGGWGAEGGDKGRGSSAKRVAGAAPKFKPKPDQQHKLTKLRADTNRLRPGEDVAAHYIFLDVVGFTNNRSVESQAFIVRQLNKIVIKSVKERQIRENDRIFIPTGDGICIVLLGVELQVDSQMQIALSILKRINTYNISTKDETLRFQVRIGIESNTDVLVVDINKKKNVAGAGISMASRIMNLAGGKQILVGQSVYDRLQQRKKYKSDFRRFDVTVKHHTHIAVYQFVGKRHEGLNVDVPPHLNRSSPGPEQRQSISKAQPPRRSEVIPGRWVGKVDQKVGPEGLPINFEITFKLSIDGIRVTGEVFFKWKGSKIVLHIAEGGFIDDSYLKLDYEDVDPKVYRYGTVFFRLSSTPNSRKLTGWFVGYAAEVEGLIYGEIDLKKR